MRWTLRNCVWTDDDEACAGVMSRTWAVEAESSCVLVVDSEQIDLARGVGEAMYVETNEGMSCWSWSETAVLLERGNFEADAKEIGNRRDEISD